MKSGKFVFLAAACGAAFLAQMPALSSEDLDSCWEGSYEGNENTLVLVKKVKIFRDKSGRLRVNAFLVGFPEDVDLGETSADIYVDARNRNRNVSNISMNRILAKFEDGKVKADIKLIPGNLNGNNLTALNCEAFVRNMDGSKVYSEGVFLVRVSADSNKSQGGSK